MTHQLRSITTRRPRAALVAAVGIITLLLVGPAAAGCHPLEELPPVGVPALPAMPEVSVELPPVGVPAVPEVSVEPVLQ